ncbi:MAG: hypothetical protein QM731_02745 [Chitinophagaceae bacterium]
MKTVLILTMNRYFIIAFSVIAFGLRFLSEYYNLPGQSFPFFASVKMIFFTVYIIATLNVLSFIVIAFLTKKRSASWWEMVDDQAKDLRKENLLQIYIYSLMISFIIVAYGTIVYLAAVEKWTTIFTIAITVIVGSIIDYFRTYKKQRIQERQ